MKASRANMKASRAIEVLEASGVEDYILLQGVEGELIVLLEPEEQEDRVFFSVAEAETGEPGLVLRPL